MRHVAPAIAIPALLTALALPALAEVLPVARPAPHASSPARPVPAVGSSRPAMAPRCVRPCLTAVEAVTFASYVAPKAAIAGEFAFPIRAVGEEGGRLYLNSETDYRDRNNLTIVMPRILGERLAGARDLGAIRKALNGRRVIARGLARRVQIDFIDDKGQRTDKYYYQVHVPVSDARDVALEGGRTGL